MLVLRARDPLQRLGTRLLDLLLLAYGEGLGAVQDVLDLRKTFQGRYTAGQLCVRVVVARLFGHQGSVHGEGSYATPIIAGPGGSGSICR